MKLYKKIIKQGTLRLITGLHIGDSKENTDIGGVDSPVVRRKDNNEPYIPGSSLKGKMRSLLDISHGETDTTKNGNHPIGQLFGSINNPQANPSRLIVRDAYLTSDSSKKIGESEFTDMPFTEVKMENVIDRIKGTAEHPRQIERIPAGAEFDVEYIINIIADSDANADKQEKEFLSLLDAGIKLLEDDYIGGSGSRGYGQVKFKWNELIVKTTEDYLNEK
ncbi:MAG: type III-A CRISPR-associated RAMP protein Csm3 [Bacteroidetes bacterium]|jgi:CRISPR-associated protein Csm3|nr:type III-A CRISPR-associated RAMP protein Csm3 [Bacteroidota bacterium]